MAKLEDFCRTAYEFQQKIKIVFSDEDTPKKLEAKRKGDALKKQGIKLYNEITEIPQNSLLILESWARGLNHIPTQSEIKNYIIERGL